MSHWLGGLCVVDKKGGMVVVCCKYYEQATTIVCGGTWGTLNGREHAKYEFYFYFTEFYFKQCQCSDA